MSDDRHAPAVRAQEINEFIERLAARIAGAGAPTWPVPIFEAEAYLFRHFLENLLAAIDAMRRQGAGYGEIAQRLKTPSRIAELGYLLIGARYASLQTAERQRLACHLVSCLAAIRPHDPFCDELGNCPLVYRITKDESIAAVGVLNDHEATSRLSGALLTLCEVLHIGVPQYGREIMGPYRIKNGRAFVVKRHFDLINTSLWRCTQSFPWRAIEVADVYASPGPTLQFDLTNHVAPGDERPPRRIGAVVTVERVDGDVTELGIEEAFETTQGLLSAALEECSDYREQDWLRAHVAARYDVILPLFAAAGIAKPEIDDDYSRPSPACLATVAAVIASGRGEIANFIRDGLGLSNGS